MSISLCLCSLQFLIEIAWCVIIVSGNASSIKESGKMGFKYGGQSDGHGLGCSKVGHFFCGFLVKKDCRTDDFLQQQSGDEDALFCTLCNAEVLESCWNGFLWEKYNKKKVHFNTCDCFLIFRKSPPSRICTQKSMHKGKKN